jgi:hypothetical protein
MKILSLVPLAGFALSSSLAVAQSPSDAGPAAPFGSAARTMAPVAGPSAPSPNVPELGSYESQPSWPGSTTFSKSDIGRSTATSRTLGRATSPSQAVGWKSAPNGAATSIQR